MRLLLLSDSPHMPSGLGKVARFIGSGLWQNGHDVAFMSWFHGGGKTQTNYGEIPVFYSNDGRHGADTMDSVATQFQPDCVMTIGDMWNLWYMREPSICKTRRWWNWLAYIPCDGEPIGGGVPPGQVPILEDVDWPVAYTKYAENAMRKTIRDQEFLTRLRTIYHGVDTLAYKPADPEWRRQARRNFGIGDDQFLFLTVSRNQSRKCIPELFRAWKIFSERKETNGKILLWPHMVFNDSAGWNINHLIDQLGMRNTSMIYYNKVANSQDAMAILPEEEIVKLYQIADAFILISGEGFGLPIIEAMATGLPCILVDYAASTELGADGRAEMIPVKDFATWTGLQLTQRPMPDPERVAEAMMRIFTDKERRDEIARKGRDFALQYDWKRIIGEFNAIFMDQEVPFLRPQRLEVIA